MAQRPPLVKLIASGVWGSVVCLVRENGNCPTEDFLDELRQDADAFANCMALFDEMAQNGQVGARNHGREQVEFSFKIEINRRQFRFPCFRDGNTWVISFGFQKPGAQKGRGRWRDEHNAKARRLMNEYWDRKEQIERRK